MDRVREKLEEFSKIGMDESGAVNRIFGSKIIQEGQRRLIEYFRECGLKAQQDSVGNIHGVLSCGKQNAEEILIGSHFDTVKQGGIFDGLLGIIAGAEIARMLKEEKYALTKDLHIIATNGEEGNALGGTFGSRAMMGLLPCSSEEYLAKASSFGYSQKALEDAQMDTSRAKCYLELHIEQGPTLYNHSEKIGIVTGIVGLRRYRVTIYGVSNHAGTTMMEDRRDALVAAAKIILLGDELARKLERDFVETVGVLNVYPGSAPVIPNRVEMILEIRNEDENLMDRFISIFTEQAKKIAKVKIEPDVKKEPVRCNDELIKIIEDKCRQKNVPFRKMPSGATHDGNAMAKKMPVGMIFVPSKNGISHSKEEWTDWEDIDSGVNIFKEVIKCLVSKEV